MSQSGWIRIRDPNHNRCQRQSGHRRHPMRDRSRRGRHRRRHRSTLHRCKMGCRSGSNSRRRRGPRTPPRGRRLRDRYSLRWSMPCLHRPDPIPRRSNRSRRRRPSHSRNRRRTWASRWASSTIPHRGRRSPSWRRNHSGCFGGPVRRRRCPRSCRSTWGPWHRCLRSTACRYNWVRSSLRSIRPPRNRRIPARRIHQARRSHTRYPRPSCNRPDRRHRSTRSSRRHCSRETGVERSKDRRCRFRSPVDNAGARWRHRRNPTDWYNSLDQWRRRQNNRRRRRRRGSRCFRGRSQC